MTINRIFDELSAYVPKTNTDMFIEGQVVQIVANAANLVDLIDSTYPKELADELKRRLITAIKTKDSSKFCRRVRKLREAKVKVVDYGNAADE